MTTAVTNIRIEAAEGVTLPADGYAAERRARKRARKAAVRKARAQLMQRVAEGREWTRLQREWQREDLARHISERYPVPAPPSEPLAKRLPAPRRAVPAVPAEDAIAESLAEIRAFAAGVRQGAGAA